MSDGEILMVKRCEKYTEMSGNGSLIVESCPLCGLPKNSDDGAPSTTMMPIPEGTDVENQGEDVKNQEQVQSTSKTQGRPLPWKQVVCVLSCLYPTLMIQGWLLWHFWLAVGLVPVAVSVLIGITLAVPCLVLYLIPLYSRYMGWWMVRWHDLKTEVTVFGCTVAYFASICLLCSYTWTLMDPDLS